METTNHLKLCCVLFVLFLFCPFMYCALQVRGSCDFEGHDWLCGYQQETTQDNFNWSYSVSDRGNHYMQVNTSSHLPGTVAWLTTPEIKLQDTHCFSFRAYLQEDRTSSIRSGLGPAGQLNVYLLDKENDILVQPVWNSDNIERNQWTTVQLALNPRAYQIVFEAVIDEATPGAIAIDDVVVSSRACESTPHFLRLGDKEVNRGQNVTLQCLLWGHSGPDAYVTMQKSTGTTLSPKSSLEYDDHMSAKFEFSTVALSDGGMYRCLSGNSTHIGVSNFARLTVKVPPTPKFGPNVVTPGATHFVIDLNSGTYTGDGPIVKTVLFYRPVNGSWSDIHHIKSSRYGLWNLQPDTEYQLTVTLSRPGPGGSGPPGPTLQKKTKCGLPTSSVVNVAFAPLGSEEPGSITVRWDAPDFSITQCHNYAFIVKYRLYEEYEELSEDETYESKRVKHSDHVTIRDLESFTKYWFKIEITNSAGSKETGEYLVQTSEGVPGPVAPGSFVATDYNETTITLQWDEPLQTNGVLKGYKVSYRGESSFDPISVPQNDKGLLEVPGDKQTIQLVSLHPGTNYQISILAETGGGPGKRTEITARTDIAAPTLPQYPPPAEPGDAITTPTTIEITILPAQSNGAPITNYYVIVEDVTAKSNTIKVSPSKPRTRGRGKKRKKNRNQRSVSFLSFLSRGKRQSLIGATADETSSCEKPPISYEEAKNGNRTDYAPARFGPDEITKDTKFVVGGGSSSNDLSNPALDPNKDYNIYIRVESSVNGEKKVACILVAKKSRVVAIIAPPVTTTMSPEPPSTSIGQGGLSVSPEDRGDEGNEDVSSNVPGTKDEATQDQLPLYAGVGAAVLVIIVIAIVVIVLVMRNKKGRRKDEVVNPFEVRMMMSDVTSPAHTLLAGNQSQSGSGDRQALMPDVVGYEHQDFMEKASESGGAGYATSNDERFAVRVDDFHVHVSQMKATGGYGFREEFSSFPDGMNAPWTVGDSTQNRSKNRYGNILAYDHSRVVLEPPSGYEEAFESDYINASYINGYKSPSMYIATQAPTVDTCSDFWWMVWQEKTNIIIMATNLIELGKKKCHKYWPEDRDTYGTVDVSFTSEEHTADYVIRSFVLQQADGYDVREVKQFHFTAWPDHGVPSRPTNILAFVRRIKAYSPQGPGPTLVHCSAGSGRTGCFIVIDMMLDMARDEEIVDIHNTVRDLRSRRVNMVQTEEQYVFIHEAILEALLCGETSVSADALVKHYDDLITVDSQTHFAPIQEEFETLNVITPKLSDEECSVARLARNRPNNRFMDVLPVDRHLAYLVTPDPTDRENNYINAVYIDSYSLKNNFLVTQMPLPNTVVDIWRLIYDHNCTSVVMMNDASEHDQTCSQYWPDSGTAMFGPFAIELLTQDDEVDVITRLFKLQNVSKPGEYRVVQQFQLTNWPAVQPVPYTRNSVLRVIQLVTKWEAECSRNGSQGRTLVHCVAGAGRSGTFISCYNMCEQLRHEYSVDVFNIVQRLRNVRPQLVETLEQYRFCYEVGIEFAER